jgi:hypothetical protein
MIDVDAVVQGYVAALLWSESCNGTAPVEVCDHHGLGEDCDAGLDSIGYDAGDLAEDARKEIEADVREFVEANRADLEELLTKPGVDESDIGHNFLLTRNHHGVGFWDRGWGELGERLTQASDPYGNTSAYVDGDEKVHVEG